jgi:pantothenate kinase
MPLSSSVLGVNNRNRPSQPCTTTSASSASTSCADDNDDKINYMPMNDDWRMLSTYDTLATRLIHRYKLAFSNNKLKNNQLFVCIAGGPGSGKSTLSMAVAQRINERMMPEIIIDNVNNNNSGEKEMVVPPASIVLPMDGFHYSRSQLQTIASTSDGKYTYDELLARRGAPWTFDAEGCIAAFIDARQSGSANLPIYSRVKSDPVPDGVQLHPQTKIVLLEGNYLLAWDDERWAPLRDNNVFDETWYISCKSLAEQRERLVRRHLETWSDEKTRMFGAGEVGAGAKADANDMLNLEWIQEMSLKHADYVIESL